MDSAPSDELPTPAVGHVARIGRYEIVLQLGQGGMGRVLLARDTVLGRQVALKVLRDDLGLTPELRTQLVERMRQEARAAAALSHPGIVTLHDMGEDEAVGLYLVFERIAGPTLREQIHDAGALPPTEVARIARVLGAALAHAHEAGVVHRDVKPENVMLSPVGPKLADFGIARIPDSTLTRSSTVLGTPAYSAPEALASGDWCPASDQFSLAATLYEALTGRRAFTGDDALAVATRVATGKHAAPTTVRPELSEFAHVDVIFDRALAKEPRSRFASCQAFGEAIAAELEGANIGFFSTPVPRTSIATRATRRWQNTSMLAALGVIAVLVVIGRFREREGADGDGASLQAAASAFAASATTRPPPAAAAARHPRSAPSAATGAATAGASAGAPTPQPSTTPSGGGRAALDSAPADAGREHDVPDARTADAATAHAE
jgi:serine/threonine-protein kinase